MITSDNLIDTLLELRFYHFNGKHFIRNDLPWLLYEQLPEEGPDVKKKLGSFKTEEDLLDFLDEFKEKYKAWLMSRLTVTDSTFVSSQPGTEPPSPYSTDASLRRVRRKRKKQSETSQPEVEPPPNPTPSE